MKNRIKNAFHVMKKFLTTTIRRTHEWLAQRFNWTRIRLLASRYGYYGALAVLLVILGIASNAYRNRDGNAGEMSIASDPVRVSAIITPAPTQTPEPVLEIPEPKYSWPVVGDILTAYSADALVWNASLSQWQTHPAIDICASAGQSVLACGDGIVEDAYSDPIWGNVIVIVHEDGMRSIYANLNTLNLVTVGQAVKKGDAISAIGRSAAAEADMPWHLHFAFENSNGEYVNFSDFVQSSEKQAKQGF